MTISRFTRDTSRDHGREGFTLVELVIVVAIIMILAALALPALMNSRKAANEASAVNSLRTLTTGTQVYRTRFQAYPGTLGQLNATNFIDNVLATGLKSGYVFEYSGGANTWSVSSTPESPTFSGDRAFWVDQSGVIRVEQAGIATSDSPPIDS